MWLLIGICRWMFVPLLENARRKRLSLTLTTLSTKKIFSLISTPFLSTSLFLHILLTLCCTKIIGAVVSSPYLSSPRIS